MIFLILISSRHLQTLLEIEPRYPLFGGWRTTFTIGYGLPLQDFLFQSEGKRFLNISFGCSVLDLVIDSLIVKVKSPSISVLTMLFLTFKTHYHSINSYQCLYLDHQ